MLYFSELIGAELGHQAQTYSDPRAERPWSQVAEAGRRLRRRSAAWVTAAFFGVVAVMLAFPHVLGWWLDR
jgi:type VI protein secretion system component VasF